MNVSLVVRGHVLQHSNAAPIGSGANIDQVIERGLNLKHSDALRRREAELEKQRKRQNKDPSRLCNSILSQLV